ncbi:unnamed protein product [Dibothriocephalus latus]|uniref:Uncharacterized protein n=1 Tax=Dibothriocephalus latus TaxID=60516 RepID=A0A3P7NKS6_DIBLA|nr:unnamed protein product [Dibothriocephalus latus]
MKRVLISINGSLYSKLLVEGTPALRILIENAKDVDYVYLICKNNGNTHVITIDRNNYTERINALSKSINNYVQQSINKIDNAVADEIRQMKKNLKRLNGFEKTRNINEDFCAKGDAVPMTWTFLRDPSGKLALTCGSSKGLLCSTSQTVDTTHVCAAAQEVPCAWSSRTIDANASDINITIPAIVEGIPARRLIIKNATDLDFLYLFCKHNGIRHVFTIARNNYKERIHALKKFLQETDTADEEEIIRIKRNLKVLNMEENGGLLTYKHIAERSEENTVIYNCVLDGLAFTTKVVHWLGKESPF